MHSGEIFMGQSGSETIELLSNQGYFGLAQTLMNIIESAPDWPIQEIFKDSDNKWIRLLKHRARFIIKRLK